MTWPSSPRTASAVVLGAANVVNDVANVAADVVNVAVGTIFGGGFVPGVGVPFVAPPPLLTYDNVPVQVRYSNATYEPFRVNQIVDVGDDVQYGGRKVLLDGATPGGGNGRLRRPGSGSSRCTALSSTPGSAIRKRRRCPGDYQMRLASDESATVDRTQMYLVAAAGVIAGLGFGALGLALPPRASPARGVMAPAGVLDNCPALQLIPWVGVRSNCRCHHDLLVSSGRIR